MKVSVIGKKHVDFVSKDGSEITGTTVYFAFDAEGVEGMETDKAFISTAKMPAKGITVGKDIEIVYNRFGRVERIIVD